MRCRHFGGVDDTGGHTNLNQSRQSSVKYDAQDH